jgi:hypothetical protein
MSRFDQEFALVPNAARWVAAFAGLSMTALMAAIWIVPFVLEHDHKGLLISLPFFFLTLLGAGFLVAYVLLVGYVYGDARRRAMKHVLWTLIAIFVPNGVGLILYFILRDPVPLPCPSCGAPTRKGHAFCAGCGAAVRSACPGCRQPIEAGWRNCASCGAALAATSGGARS